MAGSVNKVILVGNLGRDPEIRAFQNGGRVCNLRIATSETWRDKASGERRERTEWHSVAIFNENLVGVAERFLKKGSKVYIEGQLETRKATDQNGDRYFTEVVLRPYRGELTLLDSRSGGSEGEEEHSGGGYSSGSDSGLERGSGGARGYGGGQPRSGGSPSREDRGDMDDEIPFYHTAQTPVPRSEA